MRAFLARLVKCSTIFARKTKPDQPIEPFCKVSRFIYESDKISKQKNVPKAGAFLPEFYKEKERHETSVCHLDRCDEGRVWHLGLTRRPDKTLHARVDLDVQSVVGQSLECLTAPEDDYDEHVVVVKWPPDKEGQKLIAVQLAMKAGQCKPPPTTNRSAA